MQQSISFSKLSDESWGIRVAKKGVHPSPGDEVFVSKRNGGEERVILGAIVDRDNGAFPGPAVYYRIAREPRPSRDFAYGPRWRAEQQKKRDAELNRALLDSITEQGRKARVEYDEAVAALNDYDPADHEYFDGETEIQEAHEARLRERVETASKTLEMLRAGFRAAKG